MLYEVITLMQRYDWPGNVRELVNVIERAVVLCRTERIMPIDLPDSIHKQLDTSNMPVHFGGNSLKTALANPERQILVEALEANGWNRQETAKMLGVNRTTLYKKMKKFNITFENCHA